MTMSKPDPAPPQAGISKAEAIRRAMVLHRSGKLEEAAKLYRAVLAAFPNDFDALHLLGVLLSARKRATEGIKLIQRALELQPNFAGAHNNLGTALLANKEPEQAALSFERAIKLKADFAEAHSNLGNALADLGRREEAATSHRRAIALKADYAEAHNNLGNVLIALGHFQEAAEACRQALSLRPNYAKAHHNLATALVNLHRHEDAIASFRRAVAASSDYAEAYRGLGLALLESERADAAVAALERAVALRADDADAHTGLGRALRELGQMPAAVAAYRRAATLAPEDEVRLQNLGNALALTGELHEAAASYRRASELAAGGGQALSHYLLLCGQMCAWRQSAAAAQALMAQASLPDFNGMPAALLSSTDDPALLKAAAEASVKHSLGSTPAPLWQGERYQHQRIRLAYFSSALREHATGRLIVDLIERHDRAQFEIYAVATADAQDGALRRRLAHACDHFSAVGQRSDAAIAQHLRALEIDIVVDLDGHAQTSRNRALAWRPVPAQVAYLGYPATTGAAFIDYAIVDRCVVPEEQQPFYSERLVHLPDCFLVSDSKRVAPARPPARSELGWPEGALVFCCGNETDKITPAVFAVWMRLLRSLPHSLLWLIVDNHWAQANLTAEARDHGVEPTRLLFAPRLDEAAVLARLQAADVFLDTFPANGSARVNDALWCGLPVITCGGRSFSARVAASLLKPIELSELVTASLADYEALALALAGQPQQLASLRRKLQHNKGRTALFDTDRFCRNVEAAYGEMWRISQAGEQPSPFSIASHPQ
jgi:protein O-GlcNAc transferase